MTFSQKLAFLIATLTPILFQSGCGSSPPTRFYALAAVPASRAPISLPPGVVLQVDVVTVPPQLDRLQMVRQITGNQVDVSGFDRWAAPLDEQIRRALTDDLAQRTATGEILDIQAAAPPPHVRHVAVDIDQFDCDPAGHVLLRADWALIDGDHARTRATERFEVQGSNGDGGSLAAAMSSALAELADRIVIAAAQQ